MGISAAITCIWAILMLQQTNGLVTTTNSSETASDYFSDITTSIDLASTPHSAMTPIEFGSENLVTTSPLIAIKVNELSVVLKRTIHRIRQRYKKIDVVFLLDASSSVGKRSFLSELKFVRKFLSDFNVSYNYTRVSLVTFSSQGKIVSSFRGKWSEIVVGI